jgi:hypothetical protein
MLGFFIRRRVERSGGDALFDIVNMLEKRAFPVDRRAHEICGDGRLKGPKSGVFLVESGA